MKELSIEEKAKLYDEALIRGSKLWESDMITRENYEYIFPEVKESENIKIIKAIKYGLDHVFTNNTTVFEVTKEQCFAWLEKQGEQKTVDEIAKEVCKNKESAMAFLKSTGIINEKGELAEQYRQSEQNTTNKVKPKFNVGQTIKKEGFNLGFTIVKIEDGFYYNDVNDNFPFTDQDNWELVEKKLAWSEEDKEYMKSLLDIINGTSSLTSSEIECHKDWLKLLKGRVQPKQEWNEEDERKKNKLIWIFEEIKKGANYFYGSDVKETIDWLKSLRPQPTWKPSKEQIMALRWVLNHIPYDSHKEEISGLLDQIKEL